MGGSSYECVSRLQWAGAGMGGWVEVSEIPFRLRRFFPNAADLPPQESESINAHSI